MSSKEISVFSCRVADNAPPANNDELSKTYSTLLVEQVSAHLAYHGVDLGQVEWQADNGSEYLDKPLRSGATYR